MARQRTPKKPLRLGSRAIRELEAQIAEDVTGARRRNFERLVRDMQDKTGRMALARARNEAPGDDDPEVGPVPSGDRGPVLPPTSEVLGKALAQVVNAELIMARVNSQHIQALHQAAAYEQLFGPKDEASEEQPSRPGVVINIAYDKPEPEPSSGDDTQDPKAKNS
jgi:hypothetical protein